ncbi:hypothetical protein HHL28_14475 [Aerophototrophica crusticola]|uniref:Alpha/beta hydrolase domain-containing protein n=1 Tax=Aerophototrophica crusticola TaxID=1709002 RepID=A0A858R9H4_9PROT|nr:hypothetical protein HHL28_14475 [Rhodospirillaceae bacterium B3]
MLVRLLLCLTLVLASSPAWARVERVEVVERVPFAEGKAFGKVGAYELVRGRVHYAVDPALPANQGIVDLALAPRDARGLVRFAGDFVMLRPASPARGNGTLLYEVSNRGGIGILGQLNGAPATPDPRTAADAGNGFLLEQGFTLLWSGWSWDIAQPTDPKAGRPLTLDLPIATEGGKAITGKVAYEFVPDTNAEVQDWAGLRALGYLPAIPDDPDAVLTVRDRPQGERKVIDRGQWDFATPEKGTRPTSVKLEGGFAPGKIYELVFTARDPRVAGLGLAAVRDVLSHARAQGFGGAPAPRAVLVYGISQSGRFLSHMLLEGMHRDEGNRPVFDGAVIHVAGGGKGSFNHRFAQPTRHFSQWEDHVYPTDYYPFATMPSTDPGTGRLASLLDQAEATGFVPKLFFTNSSAEYWNRAASLVHTTPDGQADLGAHPNVRLYHLAGAQHFVGRQKERGKFAHCVNPLDHQVAMRALLLALDGWVKDGKLPPPSRVPTIAQRTLVPFDTYAALFPALPGVARLPDGPLVPPRLDFGPRFTSQGIADTVPPIWGKPYPTLVPAPDPDGIDRGGVRLPEIQLPLGTHTGWNTRNEAAGSPGATDRWQGSFIPFARTAAERQATGDSRPSLEERYGPKWRYLMLLQDRARAVAAEGFLRPEEVDPLVRRAAGLWDRLQARDPADRGCGWMFAP